MKSNRPPRAPWPATSTDELLRHARMLQRAAGQLAAGAHRPGDVARLRREVAQMLAPVLQWSHTGEQTSGEG